MAVLRLLHCSMTSDQLNSICVAQYNIIIIKYEAVNKKVNLYL
jgi:hypothetical protein